MFKNIFKTTKDKPPEPQRPRLQGRVTDWQEAQRLGREEHFDEAVAIVDRILSLPHDVGAAVEHLRKIREDQSVTGSESRYAGRTPTGDHRIIVRVTMGGQMVPEILEARGRWLMLDLARRIGAGPPGSLKSRNPDSELDRRARIAENHAAISVQVCWDNPDVLATAGAILMVACRFEGAAHVLKRALELDPQHELANDFARQLRGFSAGG